MSSSISVQNVMNWAQPLLKNQPTAVANFEPALTSANKVLQRIISAPFRWRFNRQSASFLTVVTTAPPTTDYTVAIQAFGYIEDVSLTDATYSALLPPQPKISTSVDYNVGVTKFIAPQYDDNAGNITFRVNPAPDKIYTISIDYQMKAPILQALAYTFAPVPDEFAFLFQSGFLMELSLLVNDARFPVYEREFIAAILGLQDGLDDQGKNIFLEYFLGTSRGALRSQGGVQQGVQARGA